MFFGPVGSGKSSLIGSLYRACNETEIFPSRVKQTLRHPQPDSHGTQQWLETPGNKLGSIVFQDTRGDTVSHCLVLLAIDLVNKPYFMLRYPL